MLEEGRGATIEDERNSGTVVRLPGSKDGVLFISFQGSCVLRMV
jgi:hypothetical protein